MALRSKLKKVTHAARRLARGRKDEPRAAAELVIITGMSGSGKARRSGPFLCGLSPPVSPGRSLAHRYTFGPLVQRLTASVPSGAAGRRSGVPFAEVKLVALAEDPVVYPNFMLLEVGKDRRKWLRPRFEIVADGVP